KSVFKKRFTIDEEFLAEKSFILVAEGISYESEIKINNNFVSSHSGGCSPVIVPLSDGIVSSQNEILINISSDLNFRNTNPLSDQINYSKVYGGINKDIYLIAVPKIFVFSNFINYKIDNLLSLKLTNQVEIKSTFLNRQNDSIPNNTFYIKSSLTRKSTGQVFSESDPVQFELSDNNTIKVESYISVSNPILWSPETPELYILRIIITDKSGNVIDESYSETGFNDITKSSDQIFQSGRQISLNGINYYEDMPGFASALRYEDVEKDLMNIKALGFNAVRVPGRSAHPYIVNVCNRKGLFLLQEFPLNELSAHYFEEERFTAAAVDYLTEIIKRDRNEPSILAWGLGNDLDVSSEHTYNYFKEAAAAVDSVNKRLKYYTSRVFNEDICSELVDFIGINIYGSNFNSIKNDLTILTNKSKPITNRKNTSYFISGYGIKIQNGNNNGFSDIRSQESQMKFYKEIFPIASQSFSGNFMSSYADWNSENPLNYPLDRNPYLQTNGIHTFNREQKLSTNFIKRLLYREDLPRIQEGNYINEFPYIFIITGMIIMIIFAFFINKDRKFRSGLARCIYKPTYFFALVKDQMIISKGYNILLTLSISIGLGLFFSSVLYFVKDNNSFDMLLSKTLTNDSSKILFSEIVNNKLYLISSISVLIILIIFLTSFFLYFISFYTKGKSYFKIIYTICLWSVLPLLIFLPVGTVLFKLTESNPAYISMSLWLFIILAALSLNRILIGAKSIFDIRTGKVYFYGLIIISIFIAMIYSYFYFFTGVTETYELITKLNKS
ncbi:MAG TPA: glycoside hydrolase family 2 TIM barrel-domain containing protein, partial [Ignavibacteria bacterium]|nr:hypothetical protein [Bacteroidota bacterium]HRI84071.1 glycoside hydrolase family 2 TIM barrel-domain containing protein [Ignavibacteria bacterium]